MKKSLAAIAVLSMFTGVATAATNVTLYGYIDVGYEKWHGQGTTGSGTAVNTSAATQWTQGGNSEPNSSFGIKGEEDLGNGMSGFFKLEGRFGADTGALADGNRFFARESTVGLKGAFGEVKLGHAKSQIEQALGGAAPGARTGDLDLYSVVATRHDNGLYYAYNNGGVEVGADVTTKEAGGKLGWGARLGYSGDLGGTALTIRAAHQDDGGTATQRESGVLVSAGFGSVTVGAAYAKGRGEALGVGGYKGIADDGDTVKTATTASAFLSAAMTDNDSVYVKYQQRKGKADDGTEAYKGSIIGAGYSHALSARTSVYTDLAYARLNRTNDGVGNGKAIGYSVAVSHAF